MASGAAPRARRGRRSGPGPRSLPRALGRRFEALIFDWDGTAVPDRSADATGVRDVVEALCAGGMDVAVVSGTHVENIDGQLEARPAGPGILSLCVNRGSEVYRVGRGGPAVVHRRVATPLEDRLLDAAAELTVRHLAGRGLHAAIVAQRLNRRKIDLIPLPEWADPPKARIAELVTAVEERLHRHGLGSLGDVVDLAARAAGEVGLADARITSDVKHVEIGLTDKSDSARWLLDDLLRRGVRAEEVLLAGDEFGDLGGVPGSDSLMLVPQATTAVAVSVGVEPSGVPSGVLRLRGGPAAFRRLLADQLRRRAEAPDLVGDAAWTLSVAGVDVEHERVAEALLTVADGRVGVGGAPLFAHPASLPRVLVAGAYSGSGPTEHLLACPVMERFAADGVDWPSLRRTVDLRAGMTRHEVSLPGGRLEAVYFASLARPGTVVLRATGPADVLDDAENLAVGDVGEAVHDGGAVGCVRWLRTCHDGTAVVAASTGSRCDRDGTAHLERVAAYAMGPDPAPAVSAVEGAAAAGFETLNREHRAAWAGRWDDADVVIDGDPDLQAAVRMALFHLMASVADTDEAAVGARGLSGPAYRGHVFWDADVFQLPFLAATHPASARAMLEYRLRRLGPALAAAREQGRAGARFPWESASLGDDVTPRSATDPSGRQIPILTGAFEEHIVADVAWAASLYIDWTQDAAFATSGGLRLLVETARYWASRVDVDDAGRAHIRHVIGPDEYHEDVDDNAFTNVMARWNLRRAAAMARGTVDETETAAWTRLADALVDGLDPRTGLYEQFTGFWWLEPLVIRDVARRPVAADMLLGRDRVQSAQVIKQADALMLHHIVPDEVAPNSLRPNLDYYEPRTAHGSSLSPGVHAALLARAGRTAEALAALRLAARVDLDDTTGSTAGGLHQATMGSVWQALVWGFAGIRLREGVLDIDPALPPEWHALEVRLRVRDSRVRVRVEPQRVLVDAEAPVAVSVPGRPRVVAAHHEAALPQDRRTREA